MQDFAAAREAMVDRQVRPSDVTRYGIVDSMLRVPRELFVPASRRAVAYAGEAVEIARDRWLLDPRVFAKLIDAAEIGPGDAVLDIGCGYGYSSAVLSPLCRAVIAVESDPSMAASAEANLREQGYDNVAVLERPLHEGAPDEAPFDVILIEGGVGRIPDALADQLAEDGRLVAVFMKGGFGRAEVHVKSGEHLAGRWAFDAAAPILPGFEARASFAF